jgi:Flp pilus assembly protein TadD
MLRHSCPRQTTAAVLAFAMALAAATAPADEPFTLGRYVPNDVVLCVVERQNPARAFRDEYWKDVLESLKASGLHEDVAALIAEFAKPDEEQAAEIERLKERISQLLAGVDWEQLEGKESAFIERLSPSLHLSREHSNVVMTSMVWMASGSSTEGARANFRGLVAILDAVAEETNRATQNESLKVEKSTQAGTELACMNLLGALPQAPPLTVSVALRDNVILIALRDDLLHDVLQLMDGSSHKTPLISDPRFQAGVSKVPPAEDTLVYFDMQSLLKPLDELKKTVFDLMAHPGDHYENTGINAEASAINRQALSAYQRGDYKQALELVRKAYQLEQNDSIILYNLACFNALVGNREEALKWLPLAVDAGLYAPRKIATDTDLTSLRDAPAYREALAKATAKARSLAAEDVVTYSSKSGEVKRLRLQIRQAQEEKNVEHALELNEQALAVDPKDPELLYSKASLHAILGQHEQALTSLQMAIKAGFYCPKRIGEDAAWKDLRDNDQYAKLITLAAELAGEHNLQQKTSKTTLVRRLLEQASDAAGAIDYSVTAMSTRDYSVWTDSVTVLVPGAEDRAVYRLFSSQPSQENLDHFLPSETESFSISSGIKPMELYEFVENAVRDGGPLGEQLLQKWTQLQEKIGFDIRKNVFELLTGTSISLTLADKRGSVTFLGVTDEQAAFDHVHGAVQGLPKVIATLVKEQPAMGGLAALIVHSNPLEHDKLEGFHQLTMAMSPEPVGVWGVSDGFLILGSSADAIVLCLDAAHGEHPRLRQNESAMKEALLPDKPFISAAMNDKRGDSVEAATSMTTAAMMSSMFTAGIGDAKARLLVTKIMGMLGKIAPVVRKIDFYKSAASYTTFDGKMWYTREVTRYLSPEERKAAQQPQ